MKESPLESWAISELSKKKLQDVSYSDKLAKLTIVIPSYQRQPFLIRQSVYWGYSNANIIMVDGSPKPVSPSIEELILKLPNVSYHHLHGTFSTRMKLAFKYVNTPYAMMHGDDEFYLKKGLIKAIEALETNQQLVACIGQSLSFDVSHTNSEIYYSVGYDHQNFRVIQDDIKDRLLFAKENLNCATPYAVLRQHVMKRWVDMLEDWDCLYTTEVLQAMLTYIHGKLASVNEVYWLRSNENHPVTNIPYSNRDLWFNDWYALNQYSLERKRFVDDLSSELARHYGAGIEEARAIILEYIEAYLKFCLKKGYCSRKTSIRSVARSLIKGIVQRILPSEAFLKVQTTYRKMISNEVKKSRDPNQASTNVLDIETIEELNHIESFVLDFYKVMQMEKESSRIKDVGSK